MADRRFMGVLLAFIVPLACFRAADCFLLPGDERHTASARVKKGR